MSASTEARVGRVWRAGLLAGLFVAACVIASATWAQSRPKLLTERFKEVDADPALRAKVIEAGRQSAAICAGCHGDDGNATVPGVANLSGQNPVYLMIQFRKLETGWRLHEMMKAFVLAMSQEDRFNVAYFYAQQKVKAPPAPATPNARGKEVYESQFCIYCHGEKGLGGTYIPRLAGQQRDYLERSLVQYRNRTGERQDQMMSKVMGLLSEKEMLAVAEYLSSLDVPN